MSHSRLPLGAGPGLFVIAALLAGTAPGPAFADTVSVSIGGESYDIDYAGTNVSISSADVDTDFVSLIFGVDVASEGILEITFPRDVFDAEIDGEDESFILIADGAEVRFTETETTMTSRTLSISLDAGTEELEIIGTVFGKESVAEEPPEAEPVAEEPPETEPVAEEPPETEPVAEEPPEAEPVAEEPPEAEPVAEEPAEPTLPEEPEDPTPISTCGEGTVLRDGLCVPACGAGLVFENGVCVIDQSATAGGDAAPVEDRAADAPKSTGSNREFAVGTVAAFAIALVVMTFLGLIAKASKSKDQQP